MAEHPLWSLADLVEAAGGTVIGSPGAAFNGVSIDSRTIAQRDVFVAIKGERNDGHDYVETALKGGAAIAIVSRETEAMEQAGGLLLVDDPLKALERLGMAARKRSAAPIIAVTGSVGKTSTKEMLRLALSASGHTHASAASFNNHWGVPLTLARMPADSAYGVFEIGMNHAGEITPLVRMVRPHIAIVTAIAASHLGHFASLDEIAEAKAEIFLGVEPNGTALINRDTPFFSLLAERARSAGVTSIIGFGRDASAQARLIQVALHPDCSCISADIMGDRVTYRLGLPGEHMVLNSLAALTAVKLAGADLARAALALVKAQPAKGRGVRVALNVPGGRVTLIDESYNANPASVRAALSLLASNDPGKMGRRIAVLGDMLELGDHGPALHAELAAAVDAAKVDVLYAAGPLMARLWEKTPAHRRGAFADKSEGLQAPLLGALRAGDIVMVKGSLGSRMGPLVEAIRAQYKPADRESP